jgi:hypothetical protein
MYAQYTQHFLRLQETKAFTADELVGMCWPPGKQAIYKEYLCFAEKSGYVNSGRTFIADLDQHPGTASTPGESFPVQLTHGSFVSFDFHDGVDHPRMVLGAEQLAVHGWHVFPDCCQDTQFSSMRTILCNLKEVEQKHLSGNGMHVPLVACWMCMILGNVERLGVDDFFA